MMRYRLLLAALMTLVPGVAHVQTAVRETPLPDPGSMRFEWMREGPAKDCGTTCREWVVASGLITGDTVRDFQLFSEARDLKGATVVLESGGGSVLASLELGRRLRQLGAKTTVGRAVRAEASSDADPRVTISPRGECASMCVFVLLGGVQRVVPAEARVLVHQIWPGSKRADASAEMYTAEEMMRIQRDVGRIAKYTIEMGGDIELFELAMRIPPWERLRSLSQSELRRLRLQTIEMASDTPTSGAVSLGRTPQTVRGKPSERGWMLTEDGADVTLIRRHPLTVEGEEIGQFELTLTCAEQAGRFRIGYADTRALALDQPAARLRDVTLSASGVRVALKVDTSALEGRTELRSSATGVASAAFVEKLRTEPSSTVVVGTVSTANMRTSIRVGTNGFAKAFSKLAGDCER